MRRIVTAFDRANALIARRDRLVVGDRDGAALVIGVNAIGRRRDDFAGVVGDGDAAADRPRSCIDEARAIKTRDGVAEGAGVDAVAVRGRQRARVPGDAGRRVVIALVRIAVQLALMAAVLATLTVEAGPPPPSARMPACRCR